MSQTLRQWLDGHLINVPDELIELIFNMLHDQLDLPIDRADLPAVVEREMRELNTQLNDRSSAGNLLAVDAIATLSFLVAAETGATSQAVQSMIGSINSLVQAHR